MGWHGGVLLEQPPLNLKDHFFQRRRWFLGTMQNLDKFPRWHRYKVLFNSVTLFLALAAGVASTALRINACISPIFLQSLHGLEAISSAIMLLPSHVNPHAAF